MPGSYGSFFKPVAKALRTTGAVDLQVVPRSTLRPHLRTMGVSAAVVRARLQAALGGPFTGYQELVSVLQGPAPDVVFLDWADKSAVLATLILPPHVRVVLRVHGVDTLRPWIHLLNWSRVDAVVCVSPALQQLVQDVVGEPAREIAVHVIPHIVNLDPLDEAVQGQRNPRLLCMVGWAQRVKDPIWALEVLSALREDGEDWRLLFLGADFAESATASGRAYAAAFRERAKADDVRDHLSFAGFVEDLAPELAKAGFVLSSSLRETWGVGLAEAVAAGAVPVVRDWPMLASRGAARGLYDEPFVVSTVEEAAELVRSLSEEQLRADAARAARDRLRQVADRVETTTQLRRVVLGDLGRLADLSLAGRHDEALTLVHALLEEAASTPALLHQAAISAAMAGEPTLQLQVLQRWLEVDPSDHVGRMVQAQKGRVLELTPGWRPALSPAWGGDDRDAPLGPRQPGEPDRVLHLLKASLPHRSSGYTMRSAYLLGEQARAGLDVVAVTQLDFPPAGRDQGVAAARPGEEVVNGVRHLRLSRENIPEHEPLDAYHAACAAALREVVRAEQPTVIHAHSGHRGYDLAMTAMAVGRATGIPVVYEVRGFFEALWTTDLAQAENAELYRLRWAAEAWCMREAAAVTTLSESMRQDIVQRPGVDPGRVFVVPNGVDPEAITPRGRRPDLVARHGLTDAFVFGYVSNLDHAREGQELLIEAVAGLRDRGLRVKALIVGDGKRSGELKELARRRGVEGDVIFTGHVPHQEVGDYYALLDVFVVPRIDERAARLVTPLKPYEAMAMQLPVVVADLPALLEIVGEDRRGLSFPAGDAKSLTEVLAKLAAGPQLRANLARQGWEWVLANRSWRAAAARYREVYDLVAERAIRASSATNS